jgi:RNA recognition motif-containing protein
MFRIRLHVLASTLCTNCVLPMSLLFSEEELAELFGKFGELSEVHLVVDKTTKRSKALAFILYMIPECAVR